MTYDEITKYRQVNSKPIFYEMMTLIHVVNTANILNEKLEQAITYASNQEPKIRKYLDSVRIEISNNPLERTIIPFAN